ncbi:MAG: PrsW family intramembrane metalloprotease [Ignavibacteriales bacterium]|nr:PrsW family intramembrane metalloprotease [Ignavibacteriales bacterium]
MSFLASLIAAVVPMILYLIFIWRLDKYEREPLGKVLNHFLWGAVGAIFFGILFSSVLNSATNVFISNEGILSLISTVLIAPFVEELVKASFLFRTFRKNYFDNITDGLVYGGAIGLGFGMTENLFYFMMYNETFSQWIYVVIIRSIFSAVMHAIATATVGAFLAKTKFSLTPTKKRLPIIGILLAMIFHATWNFSLSFEFTSIVGILFMVFLIIGFLLIFNLSLNNENKLIQAELLGEERIFIDEANQSFNKKYIFDKIKKKSVRKEYMNFVTKLAFRKFQAKNSSGIQKEKYLKDIELYRSKIIYLLQNHLS